MIDLKSWKRDLKGNFKVPPGYWVRVNMTSDTFLEEADPWREEMWRIIRYRSDVKFYILTKRALRIEPLFRSHPIQPV